MAVIPKAKQYKLLKELQSRFTHLEEILEGRDLLNPTEGLKKGYWPKPDLMTCINTTDLSLAIGDFKTILAELGKIK